MQEIKNINGNNYMIIRSAMTYDEALKVPAKLLRHGEYAKLMASGFDFSQLGAFGPYWLDTRLSCSLRAIFLLQPDGSVVQGRYDKTFLAYYFGRIE
jgi:hypothetical protein